MKRTREVYRQLQVEVDALNDLLEVRPSDLSRLDYQPDLPRPRLVVGTQGTSTLPAPIGLSDATNIFPCDKTYGLQLQLGALTRHPPSETR